MIIHRAVFGMGIALINNWQIIRERFNPDFGLDNNPIKQGKIDEYTGLKCLSLEEINDPASLKVLITAGDPYYAKMMGRQLEQLGIDYDILVDKLDEWCDELELPWHLHDITIPGKKIILINSPEHDNVGDHLISLSEMSFLTENFEDYHIFEVTDIEYLWHHNRIKKHITSEDIILVTGGGFLGSLWLYNAENNVRNIIKEYPDNKIIVLPQTVFFEDNEKGHYEYNITREIYVGHKKLILCAREENSYQLFTKILGGVEHAKNVYLLPDMALMYKYTVNSRRDNKKAIVCFRTDKERILDDSSCQIIKETLTKAGYSVTDISMHSGHFDGIEGRKQQVENKLEEIGSSGLVITDTLHCMISAALTETNCVAFDNLSGKVGNVYRWIENLGYVKFCNCIEKINEMIECSSKKIPISLTKKMCTGMN